MPSIGHSYLPAILALAVVAVPAHAKEPTAAERAAAIVARMNVGEKATLTHGPMAVPIFGPQNLPADVVPGAGYIAGIPRLGVPSLRETDASLGIGWAGGLRKDGATALPSGLAMASSWNPSLLRAGGAMIGAEARAKGFNVLLAGGANLMRDPRNGRTFEYLSEDPLLSGTLVGNAIAGVQSNHIISTIKHFALNGQETVRKFVDVDIADGSARESDLLAFQIGIEIGRPGAVMCGYNKVNGHSACDNSWLLNDVLKRDWRYPGFVMSDWGAVPSLSAAVNGLDQQSGEQLDVKVWFAAPLAQAAGSDPKVQSRLDDMNRRIITSMFEQGLDKYPAPPGGVIDVKAHHAVAMEVAQQGMVLLRNERGVLPLAKTAKRIAVIGGFADLGVLSGAGSSQVHDERGPAVQVADGNHGPFSGMVSQQYHRSPPLDAIRAIAPNAKVTFNNGDYLSEAIADARSADVVIIFATKWATEGFDVADLSLPKGQDQLIDAVASANSNTIVVLETGNPIQMPWLSKTAAVLEAWYPGAEGGPAIASVLFGDFNPSGRLPISFPANVDQLPRPKIDGYGQVPATFLGDVPAGTPPIHANFNLEGSDVGYRWFARERKRTLFPFGFGLSYSSFSHDNLRVDGMKASFIVKNKSSVAGAHVAQLYLVSRGGTAKLRLAGFQRTTLAPGAAAAISLEIDPRILADWQGGQWVIASGDYGFALGDNAEQLGPVTTVHMNERRWSD